MRQRQRRRRTRTIAEGTAAVVALAAAAYGVTHLPPFPSFDLSMSSDRPHLHPIPIDRRLACPHVEAIHEQVGTFQHDYVLALLGQDRASEQSREPPPAPPPWPQVRLELDGSAQQLDQSLAAGIPAFPPRIQRELGQVRDVLAVGRVQLAGTTDTAQFAQRTFRLFDRGQSHVGWAGDLVGDQCRVPLGAGDGPTSD